MNFTLHMGKYKDEKFLLGKKFFFPVKTFLL